MTWHVSALRSITIPSAYSCESHERMHRYLVSGTRVDACGHTTRQTARVRLWGKDGADGVPLGVGSGKDMQAPLRDLDV